MEKEENRSKENLKTFPLFTMVAVGFVVESFCCVFELLSKKQQQSHWEEVVERGEEERKRVR